MNWHGIRTINGSQQEGFEEFVCQLASKETIPNGEKYIRKGKPDAGVECFWILENGEEWAWQAKFFLSSITDSQWGQLDSSVKTVLDKHPNLKRYYIAVPNDPPDARVDNQTSMLEKWDSHVKKWCGWATDKGMAIEVIPWWGSDIIRRLQNPSNEGLTYFWFNIDEFTDEWFIDQNEEAIADLGNRYTPELNVELNISKIFDGLSRTEDMFKYISGLFDNLFIRSKKIIGEIDGEQEDGVDFKNLVLELKELFLSIEFNATSNIPVDKIQSVLDELYDKSNKIHNYYEEKKSEHFKESKEYGYNSKYNIEINHILDFNNSLNDVEYFFEDKAGKLLNNPFLLLKGEAGAGKSHLIADVVSRRKEKGMFSLLFLGQHFVEEVDPWTQIFTKNKINCSVNEFLGALSAKAQMNNNRIIIFIDAVNEGKGLYFWKDNVRGFIHKIKKYKWLGLVLSIRSTYAPAMFPTSVISEDCMVRKTHNGFADKGHCAVKMFFNHYEIELPSVPVMQSEFNNPLFLKIYCEGLRKAGYTRAPDGLQGITSVFNHFVSSINARLAESKKLNYDENINIVHKAISVYIKYLFKNSVRHINYEEALNIFDKLSKKYNLKGDLLGNLISEGLFSKTLIHSREMVHEEIVYFAYERFSDHLIAEQILERYINCRNIKNKFRKFGRLHYLIKDSESCNGNKGILEALSVQLPEKFNYEIYEVAPKVAREYSVVDCFIKSLVWRKTNTLSEKLLNYVNDVVITNEYTSDMFWTALISVSSIPNHFFNSLFLHKYLFSIDMPDRDATWTVMLKEIDYGSFGVEINRLLDWALDIDDKKHISDESIELSAIAITWMFVTTNRNLRDRSTRALVSILTDRINVLINVLKLFEKVNDPYIYERLFASAYGCALRTKDVDKLPELSKYIYNTIFNFDDEIYPHILLRDYARGVIEYSVHLGYTLDIDLVKVRPPYKSYFPEHIPTNEEIDAKYILNYKSPGFKKYYWSQNDILSSMVTEYGRGTGGYGDFGRYTFEANLRNWDVDSNYLSNLAVSWIFDKYGYNVEKHGEFDRTIGSGRGSSTYPNERIGKKYQWIAMHEILARVSDNCKTNRDEFTKNHIPVYQEPWDYYVRDIDPTIILRKDTKVNTIRNSEWYKKIRYDNWNIGNDKWISTTSDLPDFKSIACLQDENGEEWLMLQGYPEWAEPKQFGEEKYDLPEKRMWHQLRSYIIAEDDYERFMKWSEGRDFMGRWMPENLDTHTVYYREYYWSYAYNSCYIDNDLEANDISIMDGEKNICDCEVTVNSFTWERIVDLQDDSVVSLLMPTKNIYDNLNIKFADVHGIFLDINNNVICFDTSIYGEKQCLLFKKKPLISYLEANNLKIVWTLLGEKHISSGSIRNPYPKRLNISGAYSISGDDFLGTVNTHIK